MAWILLLNNSNCRWGSWVCWWTNRAHPHITHRRSLVGVAPTDTHTI